MDQNGQAYDEKSLSMSAIVTKMYRKFYMYYKLNKMTEKYFLYFH